MTSDDVIVSGVDAIVSIGDVCPYMVDEDNNGDCAFQVVVNK